MNYSLFLALFIISTNVIASPVGDCDGTPKSAITQLPKPIKSWGQIVCTPYGHIITNKEGWVWSQPASFSPVMIPSQMIRSNPEALGNKSYFIKIDMTTLSGIEAEASIKMFEDGFDNSEYSPTVYALEVSSISGKQLGFQFFDYGNSLWGMWCNKKCDPSSRFMLLNMSDKPE